MKHRLVCEAISKQFAFILQPLLVGQQAFEANQQEVLAVRQQLLQHRQVCEAISNQFAFILQPLLPDRQAYEANQQEVFIHQEY